LTVLKGRVIKLVSTFFLKCTAGSHGGNSSIFLRLEALKKGIHADVSNDGNIFGWLKKFMRGFPELARMEVGGPAYVKVLEKSMVELETKNTELQGKLSAHG
jgi:hypothetical protein